MKAIYYSYFIVLPLLVLDIAWWQFLVGFLAMHVTSGLILSLVFQLAHVIEGPEQFAAEQQETMADAWFVTGRPVTCADCGSLITGEHILISATEQLCEDCWPFFLQPTLGEEAEHRAFWSAHCQKGFDGLATDAEEGAVSEQWQLYHARLSWLQAVLADSAMKGTPASH